MIQPDKIKTEMVLSDDFPSYCQICWLISPRQTIQRFSLRLSACEVRWNVIPARHIDATVLSFVIYFFESFIKCDKKL